LCAQAHDSPDILRLINDLRERLQSPSEPTDGSR
jgi:hypothetical protein